MERFLTVSDPFVDSNSKKEESTSPVYKMPKEFTFQTPTPSQQTKQKLQQQLLEYDESYFNSFQGNSTAIAIANDFKGIESARNTSNLLAELETACSNLKAKFTETNTELAAKTSEIEKLKNQYVQFTQEFKKLQENYGMLKNCVNVLNVEKGKISSNCRYLYNENRSMKRLNYENLEELDRQRREIRLLRGRLGDNSVSIIDQSTGPLSDSSSESFKHPAQVLTTVTYPVLKDITSNAVNRKNTNNKKRNHF